MGHKNHNGNTTITILLVIASLVAGAVIGAELMRRISNGSNSSVAESANDTSSVKIGAARNASAPIDLQTSRQNAITRATERVASSVVGIVVTQITMDRTSYFYDDFFGSFFMQPPRLKRVENMGSGFVFESDGMILTNYHVVEGAQRLYVNFPDGRKFDGKIIGVDPPTDLAVIKIETKNLPAIRLGDSQQILIGEWAIAIGNPFLDFINDVHPTVTVGVISALNRTVRLSDAEYYQGMIQTDAAINPGNSGGPLVNASGEAIGINTYVYTASPYKVSVGIGFAIPINKARAVVGELLTYGARRKIAAGFHVQDLNRTVAMAIGYQGTDGVVVSDVVAASDAARAGLKPEDVIVRMNDAIIGSSADMEAVFADYFVGDKVNFSCIRRSEKFIISFVLKEAK